MEQYMEYSIFTFESETVYQKIGKVEEKVARWTLLGENRLMYETFDHTEPNEKYRKMGMRCISSKNIHKIPEELYSKWVSYLRECAINGEYKPDGGRRSLHNH